MFRVLSMVVIGFSAITLQSCAVENDDTFSTTGTLIELQVETIIGAEYEIAGDDGNGYQKNGGGREESSESVPHHGVIPHILLSRKLLWFD